MLIWNINSRLLLIVSVFCFSFSFLTPTCKSFNRPKMLHAHWLAAAAIRNGRWWRRFPPLFAVTNNLKNWRKTNNNKQTWINISFKHSILQVLHIKYFSKILLWSMDFERPKMDSTSTSFPFRRSFAAPSSASRHHYETFTTQLITVLPDIQIKYKIII